jgi:hypothetical protein
VEWAGNHFPIAKVLVVEIETLLRKSNFAASGAGETEFEILVE